MRTISRVIMQRVHVTYKSRTSSSSTSYNVYRAYGTCVPLHKTGWKRNSEITHYSMTHQYKPKLSFSSHFLCLILSVVSCIGAREASGTTTHWSHVPAGSASLLGPVEQLNVAVLHVLAVFSHGALGVVFAAKEHTDSYCGLQ